MTIIVLHDYRLPDSCLDALAFELERQGLDDYSMMPAICGRSSVAASINASHKQIIRLARDMGLPEVCVLESDVGFPVPDAWRYFLANKPEQYDLYLGGTYGEVLRDDEGYYTLIPAGFHCYCISAGYYDRFLAVPDDEHIDTAQRGGRFRLCFPFAAIQREGWSANNQRRVDYNVNLRKGDIYMG